MRPDTSSYPQYFNTYIKLVPEENIVQAIELHSPYAMQFFSSISEEQSMYKYADEKWTVKEILQHVIDAERIFAYRALALARGEQNALPGFDEVNYAKNADTNNRHWSSLVKEFIHVRSSSEDLIKSLDESKMQITGNVSDYRISVLAILYTLAGHCIHHINIIKERYLDID